MATFTGNRYPVASGGRDFTAAVKSDGTLVTWGDSGTVPAPSISNVVSLSAARSYGFVVKADGTVEIYGSSVYSYLGADTPPSGLSGVVMVDSSDRHSIALKSDGTVVCWGDDSYNQSTVPSGLSGVVYVAASEYGSLAVKSDGTVTAWGGISNPPSGINSAITVSTITDFVLVLNSDGTVTAWGNDYNGQATVPGGVTSATSVAAGYSHSLIALADGTVLAFGNNENGGTDVPSGLSNVVAVYAGTSTSIAIKSDGSVVMWGENGSGESTVPSPMEFLVPGSEPPGKMLATLDLTFSGTGTHDPTISGDLSAGLDFAFSGNGFADWVSGLASSQVQEFYTLTITGSPDLVVKISSWQATANASGRADFIQAVIPAASDLINEIDARKSGEILIKRGFLFSDGSERSDILIRASFDSFRYDRGPRNFTCTLSGRKPSEAPQNGERTLKQVRSISVTDGKFRVRAGVDHFLKPGMVALVGSDSFSVDYINYYVTQSDRFYEVGQR